MSPYRLFKEFTEFVNLAWSSIMMLALYQSAKARDMPPTWLTIVIAGWWAVNAMAFALSFFNRDDDDDDRGRGIKSLLAKAAEAIRNRTRVRLGGAGS